MPLLQEISNVNLFYIYEGASSKAGRCLFKVLDNNNFILFFSTAVLHDGSAHIIHCSRSSTAH